MVVVSVEWWRTVLATSQESSLIMITTCGANAAWEENLTHCTGLDDLQLPVPLIPLQEEVSVNISYSSSSTVTGTQHQP